jgi:hypothetical protein
MPAAFDRFAGPPVFICGSARSGTTWTYDLFDRHPLVCAISESWILTQTHGLTGVFAQSYWDAAARAAWAQRVDVPFGAIQLLSYQDMVRDLGTLAATWLARPAQPDHQYLVAKEPLDVGAAAVLFPTARFIHVIRDGRAVALSMRRAAETWDPTMGPGLPMSFRAEAWRRQVEAIRAHRDELGGRYLEIRYEEMTADINAAIRRLFDFAGIPHDGPLVSRISESTQLTSYDAAAQESGFRGGSRKGRHERLSRREAIGFYRAAGDLLVDLGYERDARWLLR